MTTDVDRPQADLACVVEQRPQADLACVVERLRAAGVPSPEADARWLVEMNLPAHELEQLVRRREAREPLQLVIGRWPFRGVELTLRPGVFVPRPETEVVAGEAIAAAEGAGLVVDLCTGSGAIAAALADETDVSRIVATDLSADAVDLARHNLRRWAGRADVRHGDLLAPIRDLAGQVDVLVANPPYLPLETWEPEVADHDPAKALVGGPDGHELVERILAEGPALLRGGGTLVVEIDDRRGQQAAERARAAGLADVAIVRDLAGRDRAIRGRRDG